MEINHEQRAQLNGIQIFISLIIDEINKINFQKKTIRKYADNIHKLNQF